MVGQQDLVEVVTSPQILKVLPLFGGEIVDTCQTGYLGEHIYHDKIVDPMSPATKLEVKIRNYITGDQNQDFH